MAKRKSKFKRVPLTGIEKVIDRQSEKPKGFKIMRIGEKAQEFFSEFKRKKRK